MVGNGLDVTAGTQVHPTRSLNLHCGFFECFLKIFPGLEFFFYQREYSTAGPVCALGSPKLREKFIV